MLAIVIALVASQAVALVIVFAAGGEDDAPRGVVATALILADLVIVGVVVAFARRGAEHLGAATLGIRRTAFGPAFGWMLVVYFGVGAFEAIWAALVGTGPDRGGVGTDHIGTAAAIALLFAIAVMATIGEEIAFRGYLFPALTRWRGPWIGAIVTALLLGLAHVATYPPEILRRRSTPTPRRQGSPRSQRPGHRRDGAGHRGRPGRAADPDRRHHPRHPGDRARRGRRGDARRRGARNTGQALAGIILGSIDVLLAIGAAFIWASSQS